MNKTVRKYSIILTSFLSPTIAKAEFGAILETDSGVYDVGGAYSYGGQFGFSYENDSGTHYILGSAFQIEQDDSSNNDPFGGLGFGTTPQFDDNSTTGFGIAYRYGASFWEKFEPYVEYGWNDFSASYSGINALGQSVTIDADNSGDYLALGALFQLWKNLYLNAEVSYYGILDDSFLGTPTTDALGNLKLNRDTLGLSGKIGLSLKF